MAQETPLNPPAQCRWRPDERDTLVDFEAYVDSHDDPRADRALNAFAFRHNFARFQTVEEAEAALYYLRKVHLDDPDWLEAHAYRAIINAYHRVINAITTAGHRVHVPDPDSPTVQVGPNVEE